jgi:hypothetical protein
MTDRHVRNTIADANPANGLALRHAMTWYAKDQAIASRLVELRVLLHMFRGREDALKPRQIVELRSYAGALLEDLTSRLRSGDLIARGFVDGSIELRDLPAAWWRDVQIDTDANSATARGTTVAGILIFDATPSPAAMPEPQHPAPVRRGGAVVEGKFLAWATLLGHRPTKREADTWATDPANGASTTLVRQWRAEHFPAMPGRPRKP